MAPVDPATALEESKTRRSSIKGSQTKIKNFVDANRDKITEFEATTRLGLLENFFNQFESVQANIERLDPGELDKSDRERFEETYCEVKSILLSIKANARRESDVNFAGQQQSFLNFTQSHGPSRRLPKLELPQFKGKCTEWLDFFKFFTTLVHNDEHLSPIEKFTHLRNCLKEPAINTIKSLEMTDENYNEALKLLRDRYENKRIIFQAHIRAINEIKPISTSSSSLRNLIDTVSSNLRALVSLGSHEELSNAFLVFMVTSKLDVSSLSKWEEDATNDRLPSWKDLEKCLTKRCQALENKEYSLESNLSSRLHPNKSSSNRSYLSHTTLNTTRDDSATQKQCVLCNKDHTISRCQRFNLLAVNERFNEAKRLGLCINCLGKGHRVRFCRASRCFRCSRSHHTLLHQEAEKTSNHSPEPSSSKSVGRSSDVNRKESVLVDRARETTALYSSRDSGETVPFSNTNSVILATAIVNVHDRYGGVVKCRVLLDSASQLNFISDGLAEMLRLNKKKTDVKINGLNDIKTRIKHKVFVNVQSRVSGYMTDLEMLVVPRITSDQPSYPINITDWQIPENIVLADPDFHQPQRVDMLLGAGIFFDLMGANHIKISDDLPTFHETKLGWIVAGKIVLNDRKFVFYTAVEQQSSEANRYTNIDRILENFWNVEGFDGDKKLFNKEEQECEQHFTENVTRDGDGRFIVKLPLKKELSALGESFWIAKTRFHNLERKLQRNPDVLKQYRDFLSEYESLNHMKRIDDVDRSKCVYFLPHHCVLKPESTSTKLRVVFDASCKTTSGESLNSIMRVGPTIQKDLFSIILRFRSHRFALTADISKMYRQVQLDDAQTYLQCILWRSDPSDPLQLFRLKTVTYGTASASFLAIRCLHHLALEHTSTFALGAKSLLEDFYVDDMLSGANTIEKALQLRREVNTIMENGRFELRKWSSNEPRLLEGIPSEFREQSVHIDSNDFVKTLGLSWHPTEDVFRYEYTQKFPNEEISKRRVLSDIATLFDPLGLLNPVVVAAKIFMQHLWRLKLDWDVDLPEPYYTKWTKFRSQLPAVKKFKFPRFFLAPISNVVELHGFSDASTAAYGCCIYVRCVSQEEGMSCRLLCAKSRVAPIKTVSLPRLELCAAELLANLLRRVVSELEFTFHGVFCWTDSEIVLNWLAAHPSNWTTFVSNRVSTIQRLTANYAWNHVDTKNNPADLVSRGALPEKLSQEAIWIEGPKFLCRDVAHWPTQRKSLDLGNAPEKRKAEISVFLSKKDDNMISSCRFVNSYGKLLRVFAYVIRFIDLQMFKRPREKFNKCFTQSELSRAQKFIVRVVQRDAFSEDYNQLRKERFLPNSSRLNKLSPFIDEEGIIRVGGRLQQAGLPYDTTHPMLLPNYTSFVFSLFEYFHFRNLHAGPQALLGVVRQQFWVLRGRDIARKVVHRCLICFRQRPVLYQQIMGSLPSQRVQPARPFVNSGVDFCGPVWVHYKHRGQRPAKAYIAVFVCFATKATHLELVSNLSAETFLAALKRFVARRGICHNLYCDNATNFVGGRRQLKECWEIFFNQEIRDHVVSACIEDEIQFHHIPPRSPHFGGLWEAAVKSAKHHLYRVLGDSTMTYEEMVTVITQIEAVLNSRPLTPMSSDPSDYSALTPGHFLIGEPLNAPVEPDLTELKVNRLDRYQQIRRLQQMFWNRWSKEYISQLQCRAKWRTKSIINLGILVILAEDNVPPQRWITGRIVELHPGKDGVVRVVTVKTNHGLFKRAIHRVAPLPLYDEDVSV